MWRRLIERERARAFQLSGHALPGYSGRRAAALKLSQGTERAVFEARATRAPRSNTALIG